ncbi:MAG: aminomethyl-transferring glycine dehydrogenase subunit GcvPA [Hyphomicrobiaceae bacterium]
MTFIPHTNEERRQMLDVIGADNLEELFGDIPADIRFPELRLPPALTEMELEPEMRRIADRNRNLASGPSFLGAGCYRHFIPATVDYVLQRGEFYTSYTPYQPEISQGVLQAIFEYQTMICRLMGMEVSNASHYDGATSLAEAVLLALDVVKGGRKKIIVSPYVHPHYLAVARTYLQGTDAQLDVADLARSNAAALAERVDEQTAALVIQTPNFLGGLEDLTGVADAVHAKGALLVVVADPISLGLLTPPGDLGADVVVADGQPLGITPAFGGPSLGIFATRRAHVRRLAGRLVAQAEDSDGRRGFVLTLATREQHIRRARATSNICTNSALGALAAAVYLASMGERGLRRVAELCFHKSHYTAAMIAELPGCAINAHAPGCEFFKEFVVSLPIKAASAIARLREEHGIVGGYDLGRNFVGSDDKMLVAVTEMNTRGDIDRLVAALRQIIA